MTLRTNLVSAVLTLTVLSLAPGCRGRAPEAEGPWASPVLMDGARNEILSAVATDTGVPIQVLYALAYQQSRFEDPLVTVDSDMDETVSLDDDAELAGATDWTDETPLEEGEPLLMVDDTDPIGGLEELESLIAADPAAEDYTLAESTAEIADAELEQTIETPSDAEMASEEVGEEHPDNEAVSLFYLTPAQVSWAATELGVTEEEIADELESSTRAAAALLLADLALSGTTVATATHVRWEEAMVRFIGLDPADDAGALAQAELHAILEGGFDAVTADGEQMLMLDANGQVLPDLRTIEDEASTLGGGEAETGGDVTVEAVSTAYPRTEWISASSNNFGRGRGMGVRFVVIHDIEGTMPGAIGTFRNPGRQASAHYVIRARDGHIVQMVREQDTAWHSGNWIINHSSIGIEHEGFADRPRGGGYYTSTQYQSSAHLVCAIAHRYHIPVDRRHIFGHGNVSPNSRSTALCSDAQANRGACGGASHHHDPGRYWDWNLYMNLVARCVRGNSTPPPRPHTPTPRPPTTRTHRSITTGWGGQHAVVDSAGALHVFATDSAHRLVEIVRSASGSWGPYTVVPSSGAVHGYPAAITQGSRIFVAVRGSDDHIHVARREGGSWSAVELGGLTVNTMPSLFVNDDGRVEIFVRGASDSALYHAAERSPGGDIGQWWNLGGQLRTMPTVIADAQHRPHVFAIGDGDGHVWHRMRTSPTTWPSWTYLNIRGNTPVSPVLMPDGRLAVFTRTSTGALVSQFQDTNGRWSLHPRTVGGVFTSNVVAIVDARGRVNVFGRGRDSSVYRVVQSTSGRWGAHNRLGGRAIMGPSVVRTDNGLEVFVAGRNRGLYQAFQSRSSRSGWSGWHARGGRIGWL